MIISQSPAKQHYEKLLYKQELTYLQILPQHQLEQNLDVLLGNQTGIWRSVEQLSKYLLIEQIELFYKQKRVCNIYF